LFEAARLFLLPILHLGHKPEHIWGTLRAHRGQKAHLGHISGKTTWGTYFVFE
jgi:hypothetical protein